MFYKLCIVNVGLEFFYKGSCERLILKPCCPAQSVFISIVFYMSVFYEQINDDDDDDDDDDEIQVGLKISRFSTNKSLYLANDTRYRHSYYERRI